MWWMVARPSLLAMIVDWRPNQCLSSKINIVEQNSRQSEQACGRLLEVSGQLFPDVFSVPRTQPTVPSPSPTIPQDGSNRQEASSGLPRSWDDCPKADFDAVDSLPTVPQSIPVVPTPLPIIQNSLRIVRISILRRTAVDWLRPHGLKGFPCEGG